MHSPVTVLHYTVHKAQGSESQGKVSYSERMQAATSDRGTRHCTGYQTGLQTLLCPGPVGPKTRALPLRTFGYSQVSKILAQAASEDLRAVWASTRS